MSQALLIPPSSNFLKTLSRFFLSKNLLKNQDILSVWCIFPNKRSGLFFKHYLKESASGISSAGFLPRIVSFEEFVDELYTQLLENPFPKVPEILRLFVFLEAVKKQEEKIEKLFTWGLKFLEVFEEFEKEGRLPENLLYPPESLPKIAKDIFEELKNTYQRFCPLLEKKGFSYPGYRLKKVSEILKSLNRNRSILKEIKELWFIGFAGLRAGELEILKFFKEHFKNVYFIFEAWEPLPEVIQNTIKALELKPEFLDKKYWQNSEIGKIPKVFFYETSDVHLEVESAVKLISEEINRPDEVAVVLPNSLTLLPLIYSLKNAEKEYEVNITLQYPITKLPFTQLLNNIIKAQKERNEELYPAKTYLKVIKHPYLRTIVLDSGLPLEIIVREVEKFLREKGYIKLRLLEIENWFPHYREIFRTIHRIFFENWEDLEIPFQLAESLKEVVEFLKNLFKGAEEEPDLNGMLLKYCLYVVETKILPIFEEESYFKDKRFSKTMLLDILEYLLKEESIPFVGDPLKGLQIMGFLETRLLSFKKLIILDVNEGFLPPQPSFNPLLTDEIKHYLGIPVYKNELWIYYFERLIQSAEEVHLFYLLVEKSKTQEFREPSRFIQKLKWELEKLSKEPEVKTISLNLNILSKKEGIPKTQEDKQGILRLLQDSEVSRYFLETYLKCGVQFYFKYLLKLKETEKIGLKPADIGNFLHEFFESFFKNLEGKSYLIKDFYNEEELLKKFYLLWERYEFSRKMDALSHFFSQRIAVETIKKYFSYLLKLEDKGVKKSKVLGVEKTLKQEEKISLFEHFKDFSEDEISVVFKGICDFIIKREEGIPKYLILDYKSNPNVKPATRKIKDLLELKIPFEFSRDAIYEVAGAFGQGMYNFQLLFYYYLFYQNRKLFIEENRGEFYIINAGFVTPSDLERPEKFLFTHVKKRDWPRIYEFFQNRFRNILEWIINHLILSDWFYFAFDEGICKFCEYQAPCKNLKYHL